jgi:hypothetical protein
VLVRNEISTNLSTNIATTITQKIERSGGFLAACLERIEPLISAITNGRRDALESKLILDLNEAQTIFGIERDILLTAMVNHDLPSSFSDKGYRIKYKDLEQFVDRYYYTKNPFLGSYCPKPLTNSKSQMPSSCGKNDRGK